jgi:hypothetical protein
MPSYSAKELSWPLLLRQSLTDWILWILWAELNVEKPIACLAVRMPASRLKEPFDSSWMMLFDREGRQATTGGGAAETLCGLEHPSDDQLVFVLLRIAEDSTELIKKS